MLGHKSLLNRASRKEGVLEARHPFLFLLQLSSLYHTHTPWLQPHVSASPLLCLKARPSTCQIPQFAFLLPSQAATMASITAILSFLLIACTVLTQMVPMDQGCSASSTNSLITLTYTPWMAPQIGPTSTVYQAFVTTYYNVSSPLPHPCFGDTDCSSDCLLRQRHSHSNCHQCPGQPYSYCKLSDNLISRPRN